VRIAVFGLGYVGTVTAAILADWGHTVVGIDTNLGKVDLIRRGLSPMVEPKVPALLASAVAAGRLTAVDSADGVDWDVAFVCVGTPSGKAGQVHTGALRAVLADIGRQLRDRRDYAVVAVRSTVLPNVLQEVVIPTLAGAAHDEPGPRYGLTVTPEFLREGSSVDDFLNPPFTLIGETDPRAGDVLEALFGSLPCPCVRMGLGEAMMVKYASNAYHALKVAFANEIGLMCAHEGVDGLKVMETFCGDRKLNVSHRYLMPGFAFGGSCLPKDLRGLTHRTRQIDVDVPLLNAILESNQRYLHACIDRVLSTGARRVGVLGISFKPGTDDLRDSPMVALVEALLGKGLRLSIYDRHVNLANLTGTNRAFIEQTVPHIASLMKDDVLDVLESSDVLVTGHLDPDVADLVRTKKGDHTVIDFSKPMFGQVSALQV
jgi:GDP-mannose 6-dehydrogenase